MVDKSKDIVNGKILDVWGEDDYTVINFWGLCSITIFKEDWPQFRKEMAEVLLNKK